MMALWEEALGGHYDDYDQHSTENEPDWPLSPAFRIDRGYARPPEFKDEEPPESWVGYATPDGPGEDS